MIVVMSSYLGATSRLKSENSLGFSINYIKIIIYLSSDELQLKAQKHLSLQGA